jgi:hypothetical protein
MSERLSGASERMRERPGQTPRGRPFPGRVGRPRKSPPDSGEGAPAGERGSDRALAYQASARRSGRQDGPPAQGLTERAPTAVPANVPRDSVVRAAARRPVLEWPRLLGVKDAATYLGVSVFVVHTWLREGRLRRVRLPGVGGDELRRALVAREDLDAVVDAAKLT